MTPSARLRSLLIALGVVVVACVLVWTRDTPALETDDAPVANAPAESPADTALTSPVVAEPAVAEVRVPGGELALGPLLDPDVVVVDDSAAELCDLTLAFVDPDGASVAPALTNVTLRSRERPEVTLAFRGESTVRFEQLPRFLYALHVEATGFAHRDEIFTLDPEVAQRTRAASGEASLPFARGGCECRREVVLWPPGWIPVFLRTVDGAAYTRLGNTAFLAVGFEVVVRNGTGATVDGTGSPLARFVSCANRIGLARSPALAGALRLDVPPPLRATLVVRGAELDELPIARDTAALDFTLTQDWFAALFASVRLRVVERETGKPIAGAFVTRADAAWRLDRMIGRNLRHVRTDVDGFAILASVPPGEHQLSVESENAICLMRLELAPGDLVDLGDIELDARAAFEFDAVDARGAPVRALIEIGPFTAGARVDENFVPEFRRQTDEHGHGRVPLLAGPTLVRLHEYADFSDGSFLSDEEDRPRIGRSAIVRIDPRHPPPSGSKIFVQDPVRVKIVALQPGQHSIEIIDELGLVVCARDTSASKPFATALVPGRYHVQLFGDDRRVLSELDIDLGDEPLEVTLP